MSAMRGYCASSNGTKKRCPLYGAYYSWVSALQEVIALIPMEKCSEHLELGFHCIALCVFGFRIPESCDIIQ